jgi:hypothetical protein
MDSAKLNDWMQVVGIFALVASLIFVGLQMKQTQKIALAGQYQARAQATIDFFAVRMESDYVSPSYMEQIGQDVTPRQIRHRRNNMQVVWTIMDNNHFQHQQGFLTEETWLGYANFIRRIYLRCDDRRLFEGRKKMFRASFVEFVETQVGPCVEE